METKELDRAKIRAELSLMEEGERREVERVLEADFDYWDIPAYIRKRNEQKRKRSEEIEAKMWWEAFCEEDYRQQELERRERERINQF